MILDEVIYQISFCFFVVARCVGFMLAKMVLRELMDPTVFAKFKSFLTKVLYAKPSNYSLANDAAGTNRFFHLCYTYLCHSSDTLCCWNQWILPSLLYVFYIYIIC